MQMRQWLSELPSSRKPFPILTFPSVTALGVTVKELISDSELQASGMAWIADHTDSAAAVSFMDLSVEAECFGATVRCSEKEVPTVVGQLIQTEEQANALVVPNVGSGRSGIYVDTVRKAKEKITDRPVFAGMIGPFSLAARLLGVSEIMMDCYDEPDMVHTVLEKATQFLCSYARSYRDAGADGILIAEPVAGLLSPALEAEFSSPYVKKIVDAVQNDAFLVFYHNCGNNTLQMLPSLFSIGASAYHFGNAVDLCAILERAPKTVPVMGNIDPASQFFMGTPCSVRESTLKLLSEAAGYENFVLSSGCDIPPMAPWENINAFFSAAKEYYER